MTRQNALPSQSDVNRPNSQWRVQARVQSPPFDGQSGGCRIEDRSVSYVSGTSMNARLEIQRFRARSLRDFVSLESAGADIWRVWPSRGWHRQRRHRCRPRSRPQRSVLSRKVSRCPDGAAPESDSRGATAIPTRLRTQFRGACTAPRAARAAAVAAWRAAPRSAANDRLLEDWLRAAIRKSMPGSREPLPDLPKFERPVAVRPASSTMTTSSPKSSPFEPPTAAVRQKPIVQKSDSMRAPTDRSVAGRETAV